MIDLHTHNFRCGHAEGEIEDYINEAIKKEFKYIGVTDHAPLLVDSYRKKYEQLHMKEADLESYYKKAYQLKKTYKRDIDVLIGLEVDYIEGTTNRYLQLLKNYNFDFLIGGVHYFDGYHLYDEKRWNEYKNIDKVYEKYFKLVKQAIESKMFDIIAHLDSLKATNHLPEVKNYNKMIREVSRIISKNDIVVEINTSGLRKCNELFPSLDIIKLLAKKNIALTYGSDAHNPSQVGYKWEYVKNSLLNNGINQLTVIKERKKENIIIS